VYFIVTEGAHHDKVGNAREGSATHDGVKALIRNTYVVGTWVVHSLSGCLRGRTNFFFPLPSLRIRPALQSNNGVFSSSRHHFLLQALPPNKILAHCAMRKIPTVKRQPRE